MQRVFRSSGDLLADRRYLYGEASAREGDIVAAADLFEQALAIAPRWVDAAFALGRARAELGDLAAAQTAFAKCIDLDADDTRGAALEIARLDGSPLASAPPAYVAALFDAYAADFDTALTGLQYRAPQLIAAAVAGPRYARALDLGCGAGLSGAAIRASVDRLEGIDLSPAMIARAREKNLYDALECSSIGARLDRDDGPFDLIVAADVFCYLGDLAATLGAVARRLGNNGVAAFSVEKSGGADWQVQESRRFAHGETYARCACAAGGLDIVSLVEAPLRLDRGEPVSGLIIVASRAA